MGLVGEVVCWREKGFEWEGGECLEKDGQEGVDYGGNERYSGGEIWEEGRYGVWVRG